MRVFNLIGAAVVAFASLTATAFAGQYDRLERWIDIYNHGNSSIVDVYITDVGNGDFGYDLLDGRLAGGDATTVEPWEDRGYCKYDAKFVFADGTETFLWDFNLCEALEIHVSEGGIEDVVFIG